MALDLVAACEEARSDFWSQSFFIALTFVFAVYILTDSFIAAVVIRAKLLEES
jgi:hypothetical protein